MFLGGESKDKGGDEVKFWEYRRERFQAQMDFVTLIFPHTQERRGKGYV